MINFKEELHLVITKVILHCIQMTMLYQNFLCVNTSLDIISEAELAFTRSEVNSASYW